MIHDSLTMWSRMISRQVENLISPLSQGLSTPNIVRWWLMVRGTHIWSHMTVWPRVQVCPRGKLKAQFILFGKAYGNKIWQIDDLWWSKGSEKSNTTQITWSHEVTWQTKSKVFLFPEDLWPPNFEGCWHAKRRSPKWSYKTTELHDHKRSRVKLKKYYHLFYKAYDHQTWHGGDLWWQESSHGVTWPSHNAVLWGHMKNSKHISSSARSMFPKLSGVVIEVEATPQ